MGQAKVKQYFPGGNTYLGFYSLWDSNVSGLTKLIILKGGPGTGKSTLLDKVAKAISADGWDTELLWCSSDAKSLDGVIFPVLSLGIVDGTAPHTMDPLYPGAIDYIINLGEFWNKSLLRKSKEKIISLTVQNRACFQAAYGHLAQAKKYHDQLEELYIEGMDWPAVNSLTEELTNKIIVKRNSAQQGRQFHRFAGAITPQGTVNYLDELLGEAKVRYIIKGRAGTGKSTLTQKIAAAAVNSGYDTEYYHCSFDPLSIDNVYIPELGICMIDGTPPHEKNPGPDDTVIDMFAFMSEAVYKKNRTAIEAMDASYHNSFQQGLLAIKNSKSVHDELEEYYVKAMDFQAVDALTESLISEIRAAIPGNK